ncbi:hypothetical protein [Spiroplasma endosymbiont of Danaus chrysippus]|nr:hypothetical protein [Spiroplasma endosymbiont of Danaus chrysippus]
MNKEKIIACIKERIDFLNNVLRQDSSKLYELENWIKRIERGEFDNE